MILRALLFPVSPFVTHVAMLLRSVDRGVGAVHLRLNFQNKWQMSVGLNCAPVKDGKTGRKLEAGEKITEYSN